MLPQYLMYDIYVRPNMGILAQSAKYAQRPVLLKTFKTYPWAIDWIERLGDKKAVYYIYKDGKELAKYVYNDRYTKPWHSTSFRTAKADRKPVEST